jgi:virulence-associated protein VagC
MSVIVPMSAYRRRGGLRRDQVWVERAFPEHRWIITDVAVMADGQRRVLIEPVEDRTREANYSETYFRRHFMDRHEWLRRENERVLRKAKRKDSAELLHHMAQINSR